MKRHLRIVINEASLLGHLLQRSTWVPSDSFADVTLSKFNPPYADQQAFGQRVSEMLGFPWEPWQSSFSIDRSMDTDVKSYVLDSSSRWEWLDANASDLWLPCTTSRIDALGYLRHNVRIWFRQQSDATLFKVFSA